MFSEEKTEEYTATKNACKLCTPLGASLVFKGIQGAVPLLHGSQGCSTYIRRYLISHFKEPIDIACSNFAEDTAIFGGGANLRIALENILLQYAPEMVGIATTCLSETIGDDVPMFIREFKEMHRGEEMPPLVHISTPSYQGTHMQGFHGAVRATVEALATDQGADDRKANDQKANEKTRVNLFPGMLSPEDLRHLREILTDFGLGFTLLPDYSETLDGPLWTEYQRIPAGGTTVDAIGRTGSAAGSLEFGRVLAAEKNTAGKFLEKEFGVKCHSLGLPIGIGETDRFFKTLEFITGMPTPPRYAEARGRLTDALVDGHKYVSRVKAAVFGEEDLVVGIVSFLSEIGVIPVLCASGGRSGHMVGKIAEIIPDYENKGIRILEDADFVDIEAAAEEVKPDLFIGNSKGYTSARRLNAPLIRIGFPVHDRINGGRLLHVGYAGAQRLFDRIANTVIGKRQDDSSWGYTYM
ncbi:nitrogenase [Desulfonema ishimotonii]|uniref:Nitrogenase n=1 Tax=Desulfonema ishimotonii TaxID=45657 RepID=A0A401FXS6_9BACT|nr:nitrogenase component 1 [Desulfonema ishimotonii]GBC61749.1 nitrogenase [Desulfonema ishimotonii]